MKKTEYFLGQTIYNQPNPQNAIDEAVKKRNLFLENNANKIEEIEEERIQLSSVHYSNSGTIYHYIVISLTYYPKA
ncbi:MAG TPA: hypothetical protein VG603_01765 [Chitinophagales bacterium]|nr:hypothetical protein [Chitinophagales bacterium]